MFNVAEIGRSTLRRYLVALDHQDFRNMWLANLSAQAAAWGLIVIRGWLVFEETDSSLWVGITTFAAMAPLFFVPPLVGVLADRMDRRTLLAWSYAINFAQSLVLAMLALSGMLTVWQIVALSLVNGIARAAQMPTSQALAASLVPRHHLLNALSLSAATQHGARLIGPSLVTPVLVILGAPSAFLLCTLFYAVGWVQIKRIETPCRAEGRGDESFLDSFIDGLRYTFQQPFIRMVLVLAFFHCALTMAFESLLPAYTRQQLTGDAQGFGTLLTGIGAGALLASILVGGIRSDLARGRLFLGMGVLSGLGQVMLALAPHMAVAVAAAVVLGGATAGFMTISQAVTQSLATNEFRGRIASINTFSIGGMMAIMNMANGLFASNFSAVSILLIHGVIFVAIMGMSILVLTPRRVYTQGVPAEVQPA